LKKNKISKNWVNKQRRDTYVRQSKVDGYRARSAYKLIEIDEKFKIFKGGLTVIDIGAAPGSWSQYASKVVKNGKIISIDLKDMEPINNTVQIKGDFTENETQQKIKEFLIGKSDVVMSDMAVNTTGIKNIDSIQTGELCKEAMVFSKDIISSSGFLFQKYSWVDHLMKLFSLEKIFLRKLKCLNQNPVEKTLKKAS
jgi:23S rRNA (uridine2552-2'-O)-methyltransferase